MDARFLRFGRRFPLAYLLIPCTLPMMLAAKDAPTWVQLGQGQVIARQILESGTSGAAPACPSVDVKGARNSSVPMTERASPNSKTYPIVVCEAAIPSGATSAKIGSIDLALPNGKIKSAIVIGDTGCKGSISGEDAKPEPDEAGDTDESQKCKGGWPLEQLAATAAKRIPDLVIHVGDYVYVKDDTWEMWKQQFFSPAEKLLRVAPWIFVRGNHETCGRHGPGYFYLLDPRPEGACNNDATDPYLISAGGLQYLVLDSSGATCDFPNECSGDTTVKPSDQIPTWTSLLKSAQQLVPPGTTAVVLTHRPVWGAKDVSGSTPAGNCQGSKPTSRVVTSLNATLQGAWAKANPTAFQMVVSGHTHLFAALTYTGGPLPQLVVGDSGVQLAHKLPGYLISCRLTTSATTPPLPLSTLNSMDKWGFGVLAGNNLDVHSPSGKKLMRCEFQSTSATCTSK